MDLEKIKSAALVATPQDFDTAQEIQLDEGWAECYLCGGEGSLEVTADYCNYDGAAIGVQFYGIGQEHVSAEAYYRAIPPATAIQMVDEIRALQTQLANKTVELEERQAIGKAAIEHNRRLQAENDPFKKLRQANIERGLEWTGGPDPVSELLFRSNELGDEVGELMGAVKKHVRHLWGMPGGVADLQNAREEVGDVMISLDRVAEALGLDIWQATVDKFNATSDKHCFSTKLPALAADTEENK